MENPVIERAIEKFDDLSTKLFVEMQKTNKFSGDDWNKHVAPILREMKKIIIN